MAEWNAVRARVRRSNIKHQQDDVEDVDDDDDNDVGGKDDIDEDVGRSKSSSITKRVERARNVRSLVRAVSKAAMRVNPKDPDAFLALLSTKAGHAEQLDDQPDVCDQEVQTEQTLPLHVDTGSPARLQQLQREMIDLQNQQQMTQVVTYAMAPIAAILILLFGGKLWAAMHTVVDVAK